MLRNIVSLVSCLLLTILAANCRGDETNNNRPSTPTPTPCCSPPPTQTPTPKPSPCGTASPNPNQSLLITAPCDGAKVDALDFVEGVVSDPNAKVWVIVHPMEIEEHFVQQGVTVREGGNWKVQCNFGEATAAHKDKHFEVMAIANPKVALTTGQKLKDWPAAQWKSQVIEVIRK